jgi:hypothetical protein
MFWRTTITKYILSATQKSIASYTEILNKINNQHIINYFSNIKILLEFSLLIFVAPPKLFLWKF